MIICPAWDFTSIRLSWNLFCLQHPPMTSIDPLQSQTFSPYPYTPVSKTSRSPPLTVTSLTVDASTTPLAGVTLRLFSSSQGGAMIGNGIDPRYDSLDNILRFAERASLYPPLSPSEQYYPASTVPLHSGVMSSSVSCAEHKAS